MNTSRKSRWLTVIVLATMGMAVAYTLSEKKGLLGATVDVIELQSGLEFKARVDTGATISSVHCEELVIPDESEESIENIGKHARCLISNHAGAKKWIDVVIEDHAKIKSIDAANYRYYVRLPIQCEGRVKRTLLSLSDRSHMRYAMLLGRDFLSGDFVVDVSVDNELAR